MHTGKNSLKELICPKHLQPSKITYLLKEEIFSYRSFHAWIQTLNITWYWYILNNTSIHDTNSILTWSKWKKLSASVALNQFNTVVSTSERIYEKIQGKNEVCTFSAVVNHRKADHFLPLRLARDMNDYRPLIIGSQGDGATLTILGPASGIKERTRRLWRSQLFQCVNFW